MKQKEKKRFPDAARPPEIADAIDAYRRDDPTDPDTVRGSSSGGFILREKEKKEKETKGGKRKELPIFNDKNVDVDLFHSSPNNVVARKIKVSTNLMVTCRMIDQTESKGNISYDYAAMTFQRENANKQMFEIVMPLGLAPRIITAMKIIMDENKKFFKPQDFVETKRAQASTGLRHFSRF